MSLEDGRTRLQSFRSLELLTLRPVTGARWNSFDLDVRACVRIYTYIYIDR